MGVAEEDISSSLCQSKPWQWRKKKEGSGGIEEEKRQREKKKRGPRLDDIRFQQAVWAVDLLIKNPRKRKKKNSLLRKLAGLAKKVEKLRIASRPPLKSSGDRGWSKRSSRPQRS